MTDTETLIKQVELRLQAAKLRKLANRQKSDGENYIRLAKSPREGANALGNPAIQMERANKLISLSEEGFAEAALLDSQANALG